MLAAHRGMEASAGMRKRALRTGGGGWSQSRIYRVEVRKPEEFCWGEFKAELRA